MYIVSIKNSYVKKVLKLVEFNKIFKICDTVEKALEDEKKETLK
jgi:hypothetical protein